MAAALHSKGVATFRISCEAFCTLSAATRSALHCSTHASAALWRSSAALRSSLKRCTACWAATNLSSAFCAVCAAASARFCASARLAVAVARVLQKWTDFTYPNQHRSNVGS